MRNTILGCFIGIIFCRLAGATIIIQPPPQPFPESAFVSIKDCTVKTKIADQLATTTVELAYYNHCSRDLEGTFIFPIPPEAAISKFYLYVGDEEVPAELLDEAQARKIYEDIVRRKKDPALLEYAGYNLLKARVFPLVAKGETKIKLTYSQILKQNQGLCEYRLSLGQEDRVTAGYCNLSLQVLIDSKTPLKSIYSPTQDIRVTRKGNRHAEVDWNEQVNSVGGDLVLYYSFSGKPVAFNLLTDARQGENCFLALVSPDMVVDATDVLPKNIVFILDSSGSMRGEKMKQAKEALLFCLQNLNSKDKFNLIDFDDQVVRFSDNLVSPTAGQIERARNFVDQIEAAGGTNISGALTAGLENFGEGLNYLIFLTDGLPTVGERDVNKILSQVKSGNQAKVRVFDFGVGYDVNTYFLDKLAAENSGLSDYVTPDEDIEVKVSSFLKNISTPVLADISLNFGSADVFDVYPNPLPDLFAGTQLVVTGRFRNTGHSNVVLTGRLEGALKTLEYPIDFSANSSWDKVIPKIWAQRRIGYLLDQIRLSGQSPELVQEIVVLSKKYGIMTKYTSFLVDVDVRTPLVELYPSAQERVNAPAPVTGEKAVREVTATAKRFAIDRHETQNLRRVSATPQEKRIVWVAGKSFFNQNGVWVESDFDAKKERIVIKAYSEAYFLLWQIRPEVGKYLSLGDKILFQLENVVIEIRDAGMEQLSEELLDKLRK